MIMRCLAMFFFLVNYTLSAQELRTQNLIIVTLDGLRWQELFLGADSMILFNKEYVTDQRVTERFWHVSPHIRREKLMPFFWKVIGTQGQLYGNRKYNNLVNCSNPHWFSYPGYSELLVGFVDRSIRSNDPVENPNSTVLEFIHKQPAFERKVAAFGTWEVISAIARENSSGIPVNAGKEIAEGNITEREALLNELQEVMPNPHGARYDAFTFYYAFEYIKRERPRVVFISLDETDQHSHGGRYDEYLNAAYQTDRMIGKLWHWLQSQDQYCDHTTLLITTDHGRGRGSKNSWKSHGRLSFGSGQTWFAVIGPDTPFHGEIKVEGQYFQKQLAKTAASFLGLDYQSEKSVGEEVKGMIFRQEIVSTKIAGTP